MELKELLIDGLKKQNIQICSSDADRFLRFSEYLLEQNKVMNLTAIKDPKEVITKHFLDCVYLAKVEDLSDKKVIDIGCGAGFPGIPLKLIEKSMDITLLDSLGKRIKFLNKFIQQEDIDSIIAVHDRAEEYVKDKREQYDIAVSRAVARLNLLSELSLPYVKVGGKFIAMKSSHCDEEINEATKAIQILGGKIEKIEDYEIPFDEITHRLVVIEKVRPTPVKYPRRFDKISKAPL